MRTLCVDVGGTRIKMAVVEDGRLIETDIFRADRDGKMADTLEAIADHARAMQSKYPLPWTGIGFAFPGVVDTKKNCVVVSNGKYSDAASIDYSAWAYERFGIPLKLQNDAAAALAGELAYGVGRGAANAVIMIIGTGVGTAACFDGKVFCGPHGTMGILGGHIAIDMAEARKCTCGSRGCLEAHAGTWALQGLAEQEPDFEESVLSRAEKIDYKALADGCAQGDRLSKRLFGHVSKALGMGAVNLIHAFDPEMLILSGGAIHFSALQTEIESYVNRYAWMPWGKVKVTAAENPEASVVLGLHRLFADV